MKFKKLAAFTICAAAVAGLALTGCGKNTENGSKEGSAKQEASADKGGSGFDAGKDISVLSREDGSGTRGAFIELFGIEVKNDAGEKEDMTTVDASITNNTEVMMSTVAGNEYAIGYCSLGSLNDTIKAVKIDGVEATADNVSNGTYKIARPFNIVTKEGASEAAQDFINYILSSEGQEVVEGEGYISIAEGEKFETSSPSGKIVVAGSSSVSPVMEKLAEAYKEINAKVEIEVQTSDSTTGVTSAQEGTCDIGMASRELKEEETGVTATKIAMDGIAVIVNNANPTEDLTSETVKNIFIGETTAWDAVK